MDIVASLFSMQDLAYRDFHAALMPTIQKEKIIGIRVPMLRKFVKEIKGTPEAEAFLSVLPHTYYEENNLHAFLISEEKDFLSALSKTEAFLPYIDNWATCDLFFPKIFAKNPAALLPKIEYWMQSDGEFTVRYAIGLSMRLFLDDSFSVDYATDIASVKHDAYYVKMMIAWYFATALSKQYNAIIPFITKHKLDPWTHNKAIQKAIESRRISPETKEYLKTLKI